MRITEKIWSRAGSQYVLDSRSPGERESELPSKNSDQKLNVNVFCFDHDELNEHFKIIESFFANKENSNTRKEYRSALSEMFYYLGAQEVPHPKLLKRHHVIAYKQSLERLGLAPKTILKKLAAVSSFCKFLASEGLLEKDITYGIERPKSTNKTETSDLKDEDVQKVFNALDPKKYNYHAYRAILAVGFYAGLRVQEICSLRIKNIGQVEGVRIFRTKIKGGETHEITMHPLVIQCLEAHLEKLSNLGFDIEDPEQVLFPSLKTKVNKPITPEGVSYIFTSCLKKAGVKKDDFRRYSTHSMRTTFASHMLDNKRIPLQEVQKVMGHKNPATTQKYNKRTLDHSKSPVLQIDY